MSWMEPINAGIAIVRDNGPWAVEQLFWNVMWIAAGVCLFGLLFSIVEQLVRGDDEFEGRSRFIGVPLVVLGIVGAIGCAIAWSSTSGNLGRGFELLMKHTADTANTFEKVDLWLAVLSIFVFIAGAVLTLGSERPRPKV